MTSKHEEARSDACKALVEVFGSCNYDEVRHLAGIGLLETTYGTGWKGPGVDSFNMGAIQKGTGWTGDTFVYTDTHPNDDGTSTPYRIEFRKYRNKVEGWEDLAKVAYVNRKRATVKVEAHANRTYGVSSELHRTGYYEGFGATVDDRIRNHYRSLARSLNTADKAIDSSHVIVDPVVPSLVVIPPTIRRCSGYAEDPSIREAVKQAQRELRVVADGLFGKVTFDAVVAYQRKNHLLDDGVIGPRTWTTLLTDDYIPEAA